MKPPWRVTRAPILVASPVDGSTDLAPPIHSGSRRGSNIVAATLAGRTFMKRDAVTSIVIKRISGLSAPDQPHRLIAFEQVQANARGLPARSGQAAVAVEQQHGVALRDRRQS